MTVPTLAGTLRLSFLDTALDIRSEPGAHVEEALRFLETHLLVEPLSEETDAPPPLATLYVAAKPSARHSPSDEAAWEPIHVRKSASDFFTIPARRTSEAGREYVHCTRTGTLFAFDRQAGRIDVAMGPSGALDLIELLRDLFLKDQENRGAAVLHATCAHRDGGAVLVTGAKGAGKSTILLELVERFGHQVMSGDKTVLRLEADGTVLAAGWPDYPHLGYGTIAKYPGLREIAGIGDNYTPPADHAFSPTGKFAVDPRRFRERFPNAPRGLRVPIAAVVHPAIGPAGSTVLEPYQDGDDAHAAVLADNVESAFDGANSGWHRFIDDGRAAHARTRERIVRELAGHPAWTLRGPGDLTPEGTPALIVRGAGG
ncbi:hypothetical protein GCM10007079_07120 [Nocardiopsis terrae]|uniref:HprK-related kinase B n=1 Tax=Nocardiopsis terrae TaxID=372655 RepID=A0ABR9HP06_9ACTN|nr:hypothetical protein [Nocardiopsis terrae]MBE1460758.1 hypothetical protein [Nocardiopsis terrae]GHC73312.1 hypothetical protein GCM10007079_07120 [Nocardiopsis terrae]